MRRTQRLRGAVGTAQGPADTQRAEMAQPVARGSHVLFARFLQKRMSLSEMSYRPQV